MSIEEYTEFLVKSITKEEDMIKVQSYTKEEDTLILEILVPESSMGSVVGKDGRNIKAIRTLVNAYAYLKKLGHIEINVDSF